MGAYGCVMEAYEHIRMHTDDIIVPPNSNRVYIINMNVYINILICIGAPKPYLRLNSLAACVLCCFERPFFDRPFVTKNNILPICVFVSFLMNQIGRATNMQSIGNQYNPP